MTRATVSVFAANTVTDTSLGSGDHRVVLPIAMLRLSDFSIDHILHRAGGQPCHRRQHTSPPRATDDDDFPTALQKQLSPHYVDDHHRQVPTDCTSVPMFNWLHYTRYHPPRPQSMFTHLIPPPPLPFSATSSAINFAEDIWY